jgi:hypothetical protein
MPKYFFHLHNDIDVPDPEGTQLTDLGAAHTYAANQVCDLMGETIKEERRLVLHHRVDIEDERGAVLDTVWFREVVAVEA